MRRDHLFPALLFFDEGGKPVVNLPMKWAFSAEVSTRTSYSCAARHGDLQQSPVGGTNEHPGEPHCSRERKFCIHETAHGAGTRMSLVTGAAQTAQRPRARATALPQPVQRVVCRHGVP